MAGRITRRNCKKPKGVSKSRRGSKSKKSRSGSKSRKYRRGGDADSLSKAINRGYTKEELAKKEERMAKLGEELKLKNKIEQERRKKYWADRAKNPTRGDRLKSIFGFNKPTPTP